MAAYTPPSVIVNGDYQTVGSTEFVIPSTIALVAKISSYPSKSTSRVLGNGMTAVVNAKNLIQDSVILKDYSGKTLTKDTDYTLTVDAENSTFSVKVVNREIKTQAILISYKYLPDNFFDPLRFFTNASVENFYGKAYNEDGTIDSPIAAAARFAFDNGATSVCIVPVYDGGGSTDTNPKQTLDKALDKLRLCQDIAVVVPVGLTPEELLVVREHITWCCRNKLERRGIFALDGNAKAYTIEELVAIASSINSVQIMFIPNTIAPVYTGTASTTVNMPGWLYACALAGLAVSTSINEALTRKTLSGFYGVQAYLYEEKNVLAQGGCCVIEMHNGSVTVRHSVSTYQDSMIDWSFSGVFNYISSACRSLFDVYIGKPSNDSLLLEIKSKAAMFLTSQKEQNLIYDYSDLEVARRTGNPEIIDVTFKYAWLRPLNWVYVNFSVDMDY